MDRGGFEPDNPASPESPALRAASAQLAVVDEIELLDQHLAYDRASLGGHITRFRELREESAAVEAAQFAKI